MARQVVWTKRTTDFFLDNSNATDFEKQVLLTRISGMTVQQQAFYFSCSPATVHRAVKHLKQLYDRVQQEYPEELPKRRSCAAELYMDNN